MRKILILSFALNAVFSFSQSRHDELAVVKVKKQRKADASAVKSTILYVSILDLKSSIEKGFRTGDAKLVAFYFAPNIDFSLLDQEELYSKTQAEQVLKTFFLENKSLKFSIIHEGSSVETKYFICALQTSKGNYRITVNAKHISNKDLISHLTIESDN